MFKWLTPSLRNELWVLPLPLPKNLKEENIRKHSSDVLVALILITLQNVGHVQLLKHVNSPQGPQARWDQLQGTAAQLYRRHFQRSTDAGLVPNLRKAATVLPVPKINGLAEWNDQASCATIWSNEMFQKNLCWKIPIGVRAVQTYVLRIRYWLW